MRNVCDRNDLHIRILRMFHTKCLVKSKFTNSKFLIKLRQCTLEMLHVLRRGKGTAEITDSVPDTTVEHFTATVTTLIIHDDLQAVSVQTLFQFLEIIVKHFLKNSKIMKCDLIQTTFNLSYDLTGSAVCILITCKKKCQISMPQIPFKTVAY